MRDLRARLQNQPEVLSICEHPSIVAKLQWSGISNSSVDLEELTHEVHSQAKHTIISALPTTDLIVSVINESFEKTENPFTNLNAEWKLNKYFNLKWGVVQPLEITRKSGTCDQVPVNDTFIHVPILETLKFMCRNP